MIGDKIPDKLTLDHNPMEIIHHDCINNCGRVVRTMANVGGEHHLIADWFWLEDGSGAICIYCHPYYVNPSIILPREIRKRPYNV